MWLEWGVLGYYPLMGASLTDLKTILQLHKDGRLPGRFSIVDIGAQQLANEVLRDQEIMPAYAAAFGVVERSFGSAPPKANAPGVEAQATDTPYAKDLWDWLGCRYAAIDYDSSPHCLKLDLNFDDVPTDHRGAYDLVTNFGTTEHVVNQLQAMKVIHDLARHRGIMLHTVPSQGNADHAMFNYNPKFFWCLSRSCRYHIHEMRFVVAADDVPLRSNVLDYLAINDPGNAAWLERYRMVDGYLHVVMEKMEDIPFVPPIEVHAGVTEAALRRRYWTVLG